MSSWGEFRTAEPDLAEAVRVRFDAHRHKTLATLRLDGSPRISGIEAVLGSQHLLLGGMPGSVKLRDLRRDGRLALHSASEDPDRWTGDAKVAGVAVEVTDPDELAAFGEGEGAEPGSFELFRVDLTEVVTGSLSDSREFLVIDSWHPGRGRQRVERR